jgi:hypothetical protein
MRNAKTLLVIAILTLGLGACTAGDVEQQEGTVLLSVSDFDGLPVVVSVSGGPFSIDQITVSNIPVNPGGATSPLQTVEVRSYDVTYARLDTGTRTPPPLNEALFGNVGPGGTAQFDNVPFLRITQLASQPLSTLGATGRDGETGSAVIPLRVTLRVFGRTLSGDDVASQPVSFDIEVVP